MVIDLVAVGKTDSEAVAQIVEQYAKRINFYAKLTLTTIPDQRVTKKTSEANQKKLEGEMLMKQFADGDYVVLLDEKGVEHTSMGFASWMQKRMNSGVKRIVFVIGGPYGFSQQVYQRADDKLSLSRMTFSHQIIRAIFTEQLYRSFTILNNEPYHHE